MGNPHDKEQFDRSQHGVQRWKIALAITSLDEANSYLSEIGLGHVDAIRLRLFARRVLKEVALKGWFEQSSSELLRFVDTEVQRDLEGATRRELVEFVQTGIPIGGSEGAQEFLWSILLAGVNQGEANSRLPLSPAKNEVIYQAVAKYIDRPFPSSAGTYNEKWGSELKSILPDVDVLDWLANITQYHRFRIAWREINSALDSRDRNVILRWAQQRAITKGMSPQLIQLPPSERALG